MAERSGNSPDLLDRFRAAYGFPFDEFQIEACTALQDGSSVLVAAPTGAGKTVVGEFAAWLALQRGGKTFYTTPIKALSNQKYGDFLGIYGPTDVGLLTGDNSVNCNAPVRGDDHRGPAQHDLRGLADARRASLRGPRRGPLPAGPVPRRRVGGDPDPSSRRRSDRVVVGDRLERRGVRRVAADPAGPTEVIIEEKRPVEIRHWYFAGDELLPMFVRYGGGDVDRRTRADDSSTGSEAGGPSGPSAEGSARVPSAGSPSEPMSSTASTGRTCFRPSTSSSPGAVATKPFGSACATTFA